VREADVNLINLFLGEVNFAENTRVLDFGCGTGNYADKLQKITSAKVYGVEPSAGMREKAKAKNTNVIFAAGNHENIPFLDDFFDFVYMTDVIHHIPELDVMFTEIKRVLKASGKLCILTQSHRQIEHRF
jgi:ubiquinone/menaquinone biosynthesis C-methylase UbiE